MASKRKAKAKSKSVSRPRKRPAVIDNGEAAKVGTANAKANVKARGQQIRKAHKDLVTLERIKRQQSEAVKETGKKISAIYRQVKSDLEISRKNFEFQRELIEMEADARLHSMDELKELYQALRPGDQLDMFKDEPEQPDDEDETPTVGALVRAFAREEAY